MGFLLDVFGGKNNYSVDEKSLPEGVQGTDYSQAIQGALGGLPQGGTPGAQDQLIAALQSQLNGTGQSVAQNQLNQATQQNQLQTAGQLASVRGMNPATAARLIAQNQAMQQQQAAGQGGLLRAQETQNNLSGLSTALMNQGTLNYANQNATTNRIGTLGGLQGAQNNLLLNNKLGSAQINAGVAAANQKAANDLTGGILGGLASAGAAAVGANKGGQALHGGFAGTQGDFTSNQGVMYADDGGVVPGTATMPGDHPANDKVPAMLSPGEVVVPRSKAQDPAKAAEFIKTLQAQKKAKGRTGGYGDVLASQRELHDRLAILEMACGGMVPGMANGGQVQPPPPPPAQSVQDSFLSNLGAAYLKTRMNRQAGA